MRISDWSSDVCSSDLWQIASSLTLCGLDSCGDSWIDMMRNARWAAASASFHNRTNISTDLPDNSYPKTGPLRGAPGKGENMGWILTGRRSTTRENIPRKCKGQLGRA